MVWAIVWSMRINSDNTFKKREKNEWNLIPWRQTAGSHFKIENLHLILIVRHLRITAPVKEMATHFKTKQKSNNLYWKASNSVILKAELPWPTIHQRHHHHQHQRYNDHIKKVTTIPVRELPTDFRRRNLHPILKKIGIASTSVETRSVQQHEKKEWHRNEWHWQEGKMGRILTSSVWRGGSRWGRCWGARCKWGWGCCRDGVTC